MNYLAIDYGTKRIGLAVSTMGIITPIPVIKNDENTIDNIKKVISDYKIDGIYVGVSEGEVATLTKTFVKKLRGVLQLNIETVEEAMKAAEKEHKKIKKLTEKKNTSTKTTFKPKEENVPSWFDKELDKKEISKEEQEELDNLLKEFV